MGHRQALPLPPRKPCHCHHASPAIFTTTAIDTPCLHVTRPSLPTPPLISQASLYWDGVGNDALATSAATSAKDGVAGNSTAAQSLRAPANPAQFAILGMPVDGTFAEYVRVPLSNIHHAPHHLTDIEAAALPLAAGTAYRALVTKGGVHDDGGAVFPLASGGSGSPKQTVLVTGIGGGVAMFALQLGVALGANVIVTSGNDAKLARAKELGAAAGVNYKSEGWLKTLKQAVGGVSRGRGLDAVIDGAAGAAMPALVRLLGPGGRLVTYGVTAGPAGPGLGAALPLLFLNNAEIRGTYAN